MINNNNCPPLKSTFDQLRTYLAFLSAMAEQNNLLVSKLSEFCIKPTCPGFGFSWNNGEQYPVDIQNLFGYDQVISNTTVCEILNLLNVISQNNYSNLYSPYQLLTYYCARAQDLISNFNDHIFDHINFEVSVENYKTLSEMASQIDRFYSELYLNISLLLHGYELLSQVCPLSFSNKESFDCSLTPYFLQFQKSIFSADPNQPPPLFSFLDSIFTVKEKLVLLEEIPSDCPSGQMCPGQFSWQALSLELTNMSTLYQNQIVSNFSLIQKFFVDPSIGGVTLCVPQAMKAVQVVLTHLNNLDLIYSFSKNVFQDPNTALNGFKLMTLFASEMLPFLQSVQEAVIVYFANLE